ncbi:peptidoglycan-binding protein [Streptomyces sp. NBC_01283]|uniref:peptidoglycan-binding domain-containing protein n=1 Tax=Streptomyces sp. NBC_01283 TaxID=2903812 RepID=UPI00352D975E|nr:peptidoglycan-binding protein [Streptomyces sp. NBC_01283]
MSLRKKAATAAVIAALGGGIALGTTPASADAGSGYVSGQGSINDDWGDEGLLSTTSHAHSNATALWQAVLWADGNLAYSGVDCRFGSGTKTATKKWQAARGLNADGIVGKNTFGKNDSKLSFSHYEGNYEIHKYDGTKHDFWIKRTKGGGAHYIQVSTGVGFKAASYTSASACG